MEKVLPYLEYKAKNQDTSFTVENYIGMNVNSAIEELRTSKITYEIVGNGDTVISQAPSAGDVIALPVSRIILYTIEKEAETTIVPSLVELSAANAIAKATNAGLCIRIIGGGTGLKNGNYIIVEQSIPPDLIVKRGSVIVLRIISQDFLD